MNVQFNENGKSSNIEEHEDIEALGRMLHFVVMEARRLNFEESAADADRALSTLANETGHSLDFIRFTQTQQ